jgi:hypothetical protein
MQRGQRDGLGRLARLVNRSGYGCSGFTLDFICINGVDVMADDLKDGEIPNEALDILRPYCDSDDEAKDAFRKLFALWSDYQQEKYETE